MPAKNSIKEYLENGYYHIYNRGVEKRTIFLEDIDFGVFLSYLKEYLLPKDEKSLREKLSNPNISYKEREKILQILRLNNFYGEIDLNCYCLIPNHFHLSIKQKSQNSIDRFMNSLDTRYASYFNRKYERIGHLFQDQYKAVRITSDEQLLYLSSYIHRQSLSFTRLASKEVPFRGWREKYPSSFSDYLGLKKTPWLNTDEILNFFAKNKNNYSLSYEAFVTQNNDFEIIQKSIIEESF